MAVRWLPSADATLRRLHAEGLPFSRIGHQMGISKNSVVGRAHRLGLEPRAPWAPRAIVETRPKPGPAAHVQPPPLATTDAERALSAQIAASRRTNSTPQPGVLPSPAPRVAPSGPAAASGHFFRTCQWPSGDRETGYRFECKDATKPGRPYCLAHCAKAYVPHVARPMTAGGYVHAAHHAAAPAETATRDGVRFHADGVGA